MGQLAANLAVVFCFILLGGVFSAAEMALVTLRESQVQALATRGRRGQTVARLLTDPNRFLSSVQVGVTLSGFLSASFGATTLAQRAEPLLLRLKLSPTIAHWVAVVVITVLVSYFSIVLSELTAKRLALAHPERFALVLGPFIDRVASLSRPVIWLLGFSTNVAVRLFGGDPSATRDEISESELRELVRSQSSLGDAERRILSEVFDAGSRQVREVMVPRTEVTFLDAATPLEQAKEFVLARPHSRYPVIRQSADDVVGFVHVRDLFDPARTSRAHMRVAALARPILLLPGTALILPVLSQMRAENMHLAIVVDEYGGTDGIVSMEDLVEELIGEMRDEFDRRQPPAGTAGLVPGGSVELDGLLNLGDFAEITSVELEDGPYETVGGYVMARLGRLPLVGDEVPVNGYTLRVVECDGRRVARVRLSAPAARVQPAGPAAGPAGPVGPIAPSGSGHTS